MTETRFDGDLRDVLQGLAPKGLPAGLRDTVTSVPYRAGRVPRVSSWRPIGRSLFAGLSAAATVAAAVLLAVVVIVDPFGRGAPGPGPGQASQPPAGSPTPTPSAFRIEYQVLPVNGQTPIADDLAAIANRIFRRLAMLDGLTSDGSTPPPAVSVQDPDRIVIDCDNADCAALVRRVAGVTGHLALVPLGSASVEVGRVLDVNQFPPLVTGDQVTGSSSGTGDGGSWSGELRLTDQARQLVDVYTSAHVGGQLAITIDGSVVATPTINRPIRSGIVSISSDGPADLSPGGLTLETAGTLFSIIGSGELPYPLREVSVEP